MSPPPLRLPLVQYSTVNVTISDPNSHVTDIRTQHPVLFFPTLCHVHVTETSNCHGSLLSQHLFSKSKGVWVELHLSPGHLGFYMQNTLWPSVFSTLWTQMKPQSVLVRQPSWHQNERCNHTWWSPYSTRTQDKQKLLLSRSAYQETVHKKDGAESEWLLSPIPVP